jgi:NAD(P)H-dependent FMN reductase
MLTIISGTNRKDSNTLKIAQEYQRLLAEMHQEAQLFSLQNLPRQLLTDMMYEEDCPAFDQLQETYFFNASKFIFITPEYNGSIPGVLKILLDASNMKKSFFYKKALLTGIATGRAGNLRGLDHLAAILNNMRMHVHWNKLPISKVDLELDNNGKFIHKETIRVIKKQIADFLDF